MFSNGTPLVQSLSLGKLNSRPPEHVISENELDDKVSPTQTYQVLDADFSQQKAIEAAKAGASMIIQGPPGTGKSQTIANIIAEFLATGKKVLFVSQKSRRWRSCNSDWRKSGSGNFAFRCTVTQETRRR